MTKGIYAMTVTHGDLDPASIYGAPGVSGVFVAVNWDEMTPANVAAILDDIPPSKPIMLGLLGSLRTPATVLATVPTVRLYIPGKHGGEPSEVTYPALHSPAYVDAFCDAYADLLDMVGDRAACIVGVKASVIQGMDYERQFLWMRRAAKSDFRNAEAWAAAGLTPNSAAAAFASGLSQVSKIFPGRTLSVPLWVSGAWFPPIDDQGNVVTDDKAGDAISTALQLSTICENAGDYPLQVVDTALGNLPLGAEYAQMKAAGAFLGGQADTFARGGGLGFGTRAAPVVVTAANFPELFTNATSQGIDYIEMHPGNVVTFGPQIASAQFAGGSP